MSRLLGLLCAAAIAAATLLVNVPTLDYGFVYDDVANVVDRPPFWEQPAKTFWGTRQWGVGRHAAMISLDLDRRTPLSSRPFHVTNTVMAAIASILLFAFARTAGLSVAGALAAGLLFAVHPLHVDAVVNISGRCGLMAAIAVLGCLVLHAHGYGRRPTVGMAAAAALLLVGLASKASALALFALLPCYDLTLRPADRPLQWRAYGALAVTAAAWLALVSGNFESVSPVTYVDNPLAHVSTTQRLLRAPELLWSYFRLSVLPTGLLPDRSYAVVGPLTAAGPAGTVAWIAAGLAALGMRKRAPLAAFGILWLPAAFAVTGNVAFPIGTIMAERLAFLPSAGPVLLIAWALDRAATSGYGGRTRTAVAGVVGGVACLLFAGAYQARAEVWKSELSYYRQVAAAAPQSAKAQHDLGLAIMARAEAADWTIAPDLEAEAEAAFSKALDIYPGFARAAYYLTVHLRRNERFEEAAAIYEDYLNVVPDDQGAHSQIIHIYMSLGDPERALPHARNAYELNPNGAGLLEQYVAIEASSRGFNHKDVKE